MTDQTVTTETARFETASITTLRHALLADADVHENRAAAYSGASTGTEMAAWCGLLLAGSHNRMAAALLGLLGDPRVPADLAERGRSLVGQVLAGWPEVLEGANDDLPAAPVPQIEGQTVIALVPGRQDTPAEVPLTAPSMTRQAPREFDPCLIRFERRAQEIWANFFDRDGQATGTSTHQGDATVAGLIAYYEHRGWSVAEPAEDESGAAR